MLNADEPKVIALDVLFPDPTTPEDDDALARSVSEPATWCWPRS